ncbi:MAG: TRAP transporter small permease [Pararhodobacter sp.]|nr:TRAP transporter small permease [Pararhodobacter sp.]
MPLIRLLRALSDAVLRLERLALMALVAALAGLVLVNVGFRAFGRTLAWADELAVLCMTLAAFVGASLMLRARIDPAVRILHEVSGPALVRALRIAVSVLSALFGLALIWLCWRWFDLPGLVAAGFDIDAYEMARFNFLYTEVTPVMGLPSFWFYLVMPWFALSLSLHALTNLAEDAGLIAPRALAHEFRPEEGQGQ